MTTSSSALRTPQVARPRRVLPLSVITVMVVTAATVAVWRVGIPVGGLSSVAWRLLWLASGG
jgi:hypothetical protein